MPAGSDQYRVLLANPNTQRLINYPWDKTSLTEIQADDCYAPGRIGFAGILMGHPRLLLATGWGGTAFKFSLEIGQHVGRILANEPIEKGRAHEY